MNFMYKVKKDHLKTEVQKVPTFKGVDGPALELLKKSGAGLRHTQRVIAAMEAAFRGTHTPAAKCDFDVIFSPQYTSVADVLTALKASSLQENAYVFACMALLEDVVGLGGTSGVTGCGTTRALPFQNLGSGRKKAGDGAAWSAAIRDALQILGEQCSPKGWCTKFEDYYGAPVCAMMMLIASGEPVGSPYDGPISRANSAGVYPKLTKDDLPMWVECFNNCRA